MKIFSPMTRYAMSMLYEAESLRSSTERRLADEYNAHAQIIDAVVHPHLDIFQRELCLTQDTFVTETPVWSKSKPRLSYHMNYLHPAVRPEDRF